MGNKGSFVFYTEYREHLSMLPPEQVGELMFALMDYQETGEVPDLPKGSALAMLMVDEKMVDLGFNRDYESPDDDGDNVDASGYCRKTLRYSSKVDTRTNRLIS